MKNDLKMSPIVVVICIVIILYILTTRGLPQLLSWLCHKHFHTYVRIGQIQILRLSLKNILIKRNGMEIAIESIGVTSSLFTRSASKLLVLCVNDVRLEKANSFDEKLRDKQQITSYNTSKLLNNSWLQSFLTLSQILSIHVTNVNLIALRVITESLIHVTVQEIRIEGVFEKSMYQLTLNITNANCKILEPLSVNVDENEYSQPCLSEIALSCLLCATVDYKDFFVVHEIFVQLTPEITLSENLLHVLATRNVEEKKICNVNNANEESLNISSWRMPKKVTGGINVLKVKIVGHRNVSGVVRKIQINFTQSMINENELKLDIDDLSLSNGTFDMLFLNQIRLLLELKDKKAKLNFSMNSLSLVYYDDEIKYWLRHWPESKPKSESQPPSQRKVNLFERFLADKLVEYVFDFRDVCLTFHSACDANVCHFGWTSVHIIANANNDSATKSYLSFIRLNDAEILVESIWCHLGKLPPERSNKYHNWNTIVFLGIVLFKIKNHPLSTKIDGMIDHCQLEWSPLLANLLVLISDNFLKNRKTSTKTLTSKDESKSIQLNTRITLNNFNLFCVTNNDVFLVVRIDSTICESTRPDFSLTVDRFSIVSSYKINSFYPCVKLDDLNQCGLMIRQLNSCYDRSEQRLIFVCSESIHFIWTPSFHMSVWQIVQDISRAKSTFTVESSSSSTKSRLNTLINIQGNLKMTIVLSAKHTIVINTDKVKIIHTANHFNIDTEQDIEIDLDEHKIFVFHEFHLSRIACTEQLRFDRATFQDLVLPENRVCLVNVTSIHVIFPYGCLFAEAFAEEGISVMKMLKSLHKKTPSEFTVDSPLPCDLVIKIELFHLEIGDDPFEVKLRDNFELLEDEFVENQKREKMLDARLDELRKEHLLLPAVKVDELYANLQKKNTDIYIQRSRQMYCSTPRRTCLGTWRISNVEILALADLSLHGKENVLKHMKNFDSDSPFPDEGLEFSTLWCRRVRANCTNAFFTLRDYPSPLLNATNFHVWGTLIGAEQMATKRAKRSVFITLEDPWCGTTIDRTLTPLKFYYDLSCEAESFVAGYGPCWEPAMSYMNLVMELINKPSSDPSPSLPFWDKIRLLFHGRLTLYCKQMAMILHASLDPYNTTEEMDFTWTEIVLDWTNAKIILKGNLSVYVRTASKYDDCRFLHVPNLKLTIKLDWLCLADPNDHHSIMQCAPDKIPEYSINQVHDSYRAFRSLNLNMSVSFETRSSPNFGDNVPAMLFYSSTLRWLECLKTILSGINRPVRRGPLFRNSKPRKLQLSRHYKSVRLSLSLHQFDISYWMSFAKLRGYQLRAGKLTLSSEHNLSIVPVDDGLKHRARAEWTIAYMNCELNDVTAWLRSSYADDEEEREMNVSYSKPQETYFLSLSRVSYGREAVPQDSQMSETPTHCLVIHGLKGAWTKGNRDIIFSLFDSYVNNKLLRRSLSTEALKGFKVDSNLKVDSTPLKSRGNSTTVTPGSTASPQSWGGRQLQSSPAITMLQQLIAEADSKATVFTEDLAGNTREQQLHGVADCQTDDVLHKNWLIELINSQVMLKGSETSGYVIMSAAKTQILQRVHLPVWRDCSLVSKTTWVGSFECMQYYATVDPGELSPSLDNIFWLTVDNIEEKESMVVADLPDLVGSGQGVGGVVSGTVGGADPQSSVQLQRIVSRCGCQFFYASYGENVDPKNFSEVPPLPPEECDLWPREEPVDSFTLTHHDLNFCTNSLQYAMLLDIINNVLLHVEMKKKEANEKLQRMRFQLQLAHVQDQRTPILHLQNQVRKLLSNLRRLEREMYLVQRSADDDEPNEQLIQDLERQIYECKVLLNAQADELAMMISCFKDQQLSARRMSHTRNDEKVNARRWNEVCFKHAQWRLTETDGQCGIADIMLSNFLYSKQTKKDDSVEHLLELGYIKMTNLIPNQMYKEVLQPTNLNSNIPFDRQCAIRIFCREKPAVGGIAIKEHLEVNVVPLTLRLTHQFTAKVKQFCFPTMDDSDAEVKNVKTKTCQPRKGLSSEDDIEKMKERAEKNKMFLYIKIPEVPVCLSFRADKEKTIMNVHDFNLLIPNLEYHNKTWTWCDLLMATESDFNKALLSQAIKHKLQIKGSKPNAEEEQQPQDKARLLMGAKLVGPVEKSTKRATLFSKSNK